MADIDDWMRGNGTDALEGSDPAVYIDDYTKAYLQDPLDNLLHAYSNVASASVTSNTAITVGAGSVCCANSSGTIHRMRRNTATVTADESTHMDSGTSIGASKTFYVYAVADADASTWTVKLSLESSFPSSTTYALRVAWGTTDDDGYINFIDLYGANSVGPKATAWVCFHGRDGSGFSAGDIKSSYNVSSVTAETGSNLGEYTVTWGTPFANTNYCVICGTTGTIGESAFVKDEADNITPQKYTTHVYIKRNAQNQDTTYQTQANELYVVVFG